MHLQFIYLYRIYRFARFLFNSDNITIINCMYLIRVILKRILVVNSSINKPEKTFDF